MTSKGVGRIKPLKVLLFTRYDRLGASSRLRALQYTGALEQLGIECTVSPLLGDDHFKRVFQGKRKRLTKTVIKYVRRFWQLHRAGQFDVVWVEKELFPWFPAWAEKRLVRRGIPFVMDIDDAWFHRYDQHRVGLIRRLLGHKIDDVMRTATIVAAGNAYLGERAKRAGAPRIELLPTAVDKEKYRARSWEGENPQRIRIGWIGQPFTQHYLSVAMPAIRRVAEQHRVELVLIGAQMTINESFPVLHKPWSEETEAEELGTFDVGIMPLFDEPFERGKCGYKLIQYMASGIPIVASPVGVNSDIVDDTCGFLANTEDEWVEALLELVRDRELRQSMGRAGRDRFERMYSTDTTVKTFANLLHLANQTRQERDRRRNVASWTRGEP